MRRMNWLMIFAVVIAMAMAMTTTAAAQSKFSGTCNQGKPDPNYTLPAGDKPDHSVTLAKATCTWKSGELGGVALKDEVDVYTSDTSGNKSHDKGYGVGTAANGDKYFVHFEGTTNLEKNAPVSSTCTFSFAGGTGKLKGLTGKGTCTGKFDATGAAAFDIQGEYQIPAAKAK